MPHRFLSFIRACAANPRTSTTGLVLVLGAIGAIAANWRILLDPTTATPVVSAFITGLGLLLAADQTPKVQP